MKTKINLLVFAVCASFGLNAQQGIIWDSEITVADGSVYGNARPRISLATNDVPLVLFGEAASGLLYVARLNGTVFGTPTGIVPAGMSTYLANWTGPDIGTDGDNVVVVFKAQPYTTADNYTVRSTDGGLTFADTVRADSHDEGQTWMPALDMDDNGNPIVTYMTFDAFGGDERIAVAQSLDGGLSYQPQVTATASAPGVACDCCPPEVVSSGNYVLSVFRNNESNIRDGYAALSENGGATFTSTLNLDNLGWNINSCPSTGLHAVIIGDSAYTVSASKGSGKYRVYISSVGLNGGLTLSSVLMMDPPTDGPGDTQNYPRISGANDTIVMVWEERVAGNMDIKIAVTTDGLVQTIVGYKSVVNADPTGTQSKPDVVYKDGYVHVVFQDYNSGNVIYRRGLVADVTGVNENNLLGLSIAPNPAKDLVTLSGISHKELRSIDMINLLGESVECSFESMNGLISVDLTNLESKGIYLMKITATNGSTHVERIVVQ